MSKVIITEQTAAVLTDKVLAMMDSSGYAGASTTKKSLRNWYPVSNSADAEMVTSLPLLRDRSADAYRNIPLATSAIETANNSIVGPGLKYNSAIDHEFLDLHPDAARAWQKTAEREFALATDTRDFDASRQNCFGELQGLAFLTTLVGGDVFGLLPKISRRRNPYDISLQLIEGHRICNPDLSMDTERLAAGISVDNYGAPLTCFIRNTHPGGLGYTPPKWQEVPFYGKKSGRLQVIHLFDQKRPGQRRGIPYLAPVLEKLKQLGRYSDAELVAAIISGMFTVFIKTESGPQAGQPISPYNPNGMEPAGVKSGRDDYALGNGTIIEGVPGDEINSINPGRPNSEFDPFTTAITREIGAALQQPIEVLTKHFKSSYTASRAAFLQAWLFYKNRRVWLQRHFCQPILEEILTEAVLMGRISAPGFLEDPAIKRAYCGAQWIGPAQGQINEAIEVKAAAQRVAEGFTTAAQETQAMNGGDWDENMKIRFQEEVARAGVATMMRRNNIKNPPPQQQPGNKKNAAN